MDPNAAATAMLARMDTNTDGKLSPIEVADNERMKNSFSEYDSNKDGSIDQGEIMAQLRKRNAAGGGGGGSGAARGAPSN